MPGSASRTRTAPADRRGTVWSESSLTLAEHEGPHPASRTTQSVYRLGKRARVAGLSAADAVEALVARRDDLLPPRRYRLVGGGDFTEVGRRFAAELVELGDLGRDDAVLDIGCGSGRMAIPLLDNLGPDGRYRGFDIVPEWIRWCQQARYGARPALRVHRRRHREPDVQPDRAV